MKLKPVLLKTFARNEMLFEYERNKTKKKKTAHQSKYDKIAKTLSIAPDGHHLSIDQIVLIELDFDCVSTENHTIKFFFFMIAFKCKKMFRL